jgi:hypothetical protein
VAGDRRAHASRDVTECSRVETEQSGKGRVHGIDVQRAEEERRQHHGRWRAEARRETALHQPPTQELFGEARRQADAEQRERERATAGSVERGFELRHRAALTEPEQVDHGVQAEGEGDRAEREQHDAAQRDAACPQAEALARALRRERCAGEGEQPQEQLEAGPRIANACAWFCAAGAASARRAPRSREAAMAQDTCQRWLCRRAACLAGARLRSRRERASLHELPGADLPRGVRKPRSNSRRGAARPDDEGTFGIMPITTPRSRLSLCATLDIDWHGRKPSRSAGAVRQPEGRCQLRRQFRMRPSAAK